MKVALCQTNIVDDLNKNLETASSMILKSVKENVDLIMFPEMFNCPYENEKIIEFAETEKDSLTLKTISKLASENETYILAGSIPEKDLQNKIYNTSYFFDKKGGIIAKHRKMHLFDDENDILTAGNSVTTVETEFGKIGIGICYDIRFPELARAMVLEGADILCYPGAFDLTTGPTHWELSFRDNSLDNQVFCIGVAPALDKNASYKSYGHSIITNPWGEVITQGKFDEELIIQEIDLNELKKS